MTNYRVHPIDTVVFHNFLAIFLGVMGGVLNYLLGGSIAPFAVSHTNVILLAFYFLLIHLQHSQIWIAATGPLGLVLMSPAHHQLHHSDNPIHFDKNFGFCLALWDWMAGTLHVPQRERERLNFGIEVMTPRHHTAIGGLVTPFVDAWGRLASTPVRRRRLREPDAVHAVRPAPVLHDLSVT